MVRLELAVVLFLTAACSGDRRAGDGGVELDAGPSADAEQIEASVESRDSGTLPDGGMAGITEGGITLEGGGPPPPGRVRCYFGENYNCNREGEECCMSRDVCYFPAEEPEFCPGG